MTSHAALSDEDRARAAVEAAEQVRATLRAHPGDHVESRKG